MMMAVQIIVRDFKVSPLFHKNQYQKRLLKNKFFITINYSEYKNFELT